MTKSELAVWMSNKTFLVDDEADKFLAAFVDVVSSVLADGEKITLAGFGTFSVSERKEREGRNPATGEKITIPASKIVRFSPGKKLKETVDN